MRRLCLLALLVFCHTGCSYELSAVPAHARLTCEGEDECPGGWVCSPGGWCQLTSCGNGEPDPGEACDLGVFNSDQSPDTCRVDCVLPYCGDGVLDAGETCDDGDTVDSGNGCSATCTRVGFCGDGIVQEAMENCEDGNLENEDGCSKDCVSEEDMVLIEGGLFTMGSPESQIWRGEDEGQHLVRITRNFFLGSHEVTQLEYEAVTGENPADFGPNGDYPSMCEPDAQCPIENVSWYDAIRFANAKSNAVGLVPCYRIARGETMYDLPRVTFVGLQCPGYRLPTEAEWEYAARGGSTTAFYNGDLLFASNSCGVDANLSDIAWYCANAGMAGGNPGASPIMRMQPNAWGLYDMSGNVWEWTSDLYGPYNTDPDTQSDPLGSSVGLARVVRGGGWTSNPRNCRSAARNDSAPGARASTIGFRLARTVP